MTNYIIGQQPPKTLFEYDTESGNLTVSLENSDPINVNGSSNGITPLNNLDITGNVVKLDNKYNCYTIKPTSTLNLVFDNSNVNQEVGGEFYLMIDLSDGIQTINFPDTFKWKNNTAMPNISNTSLYIFKCTYLYTDPIAYTGEFITSVTNTDYEKGLWIFTDSNKTNLYSNFDDEFSEQGDLYVNLLTLNRDNNSQYYIDVNKDAQVDNITFTSHNSLDEIGNVVVNINDGGSVERIDIENDEWSDFYYSHPGVSVKVNNGRVFVCF